jgi:NADPH:quinone reductase-like Zn-dependent oxidoreductase
MKCIVYSGCDASLVQQIRPLPKVRRGHMLVRVEAAGLNPVDAKEVMGDKLPPTWTYTRSLLKSHILNGTIPGFDFAGVCVDESNPYNVNTKEQFSYGTKVFGTMPPLHGTLAEYISVPMNQVSTMPANITYQEAAALPLAGYVAFTLFGSIQSFHFYCCCMVAHALFSLLCPTCTV